MTTSFKILGVGVCTLLGALVAGCGTGDDNNDATGGGGGASGSGGSTATGGSGTGGAAAAVTKIYTFTGDGNTEGFSINTSKSTDPMYTNLGSETPAPVLGWGSKDSDAASTTPGCLVIEAQFSSWNQSVSAEVNGPLDAMGGPLDLSKSTLSMQVWLDSGLSPLMDAPGGAVFFVKSGNQYLWGQAPWFNLDKPGTWQTVRFNTAAPDPGSNPMWDPSNPIQLGVQISSGGGGTHTADEYGPTLPTKVFVDNITVRPN